MGISRNFFVPLMSCVLEQQTKRRVRVLGTKQMVGRVVEDRLERIDVTRLVVDEKNVDCLLLHALSH